MADRPPKFQLIDLKLDGGLSEYITTRREAGDSFDTIAKLLWSDTGISVTGATIANWVNDLSPTEAAS